MRKKDDSRLDLDADLDKVAGDFLKDVEAAAKEVKQRKQEDAEKDRRNTVRKKDRRTSFIIIAVATLILLVFAYCLYARQPAAPTTKLTPQQQLNPKINVNNGTNGQKTTPRLRPPTGPSNRQLQPPPNEYEPAPQ